MPSHGNDGPIFFEALQALGEHLAAHVLHHQVDSPAVGQLAHPFGELFPGIVDSVVGTHLHRPVELLVGTGGGDDRRPGVAGDLDGGAADPGPGGLNQDRVAGAEPAAAHQHVPGGAEGDGDRRRVLEANVVRQRLEGGHRQTHELRVAAGDPVSAGAYLSAQVVSPCQAVLTGAAGKAVEHPDPVSLLDAAVPTPDRRHLPRVLQTQRVGEGDWEPRHPGAHVQVHMVHPGGPDPNQGLTRLGLRVWGVFVGQYLGSSELAEPGYLHHLPPLPSNRRSGACRDPSLRRAGSYSGG